MASFHKACDIPWGLRASQASSWGWLKNSLPRENGPTLGRLCPPEAERRTKGVGGATWEGRIGICLALTLTGSQEPRHC